jgi:hypothetical protein
MPRTSFAIAAEVARRQFPSGRSGSRRRVIRRKPASTSWPRQRHAAPSRREVVRTTFDHHPPIGLPSDIVFQKERPNSPIVMEGGGHSRTQLSEPGARFGRQQPVPREPFRYRYRVAKSLELYTWPSEYLAFRRFARMHRGARQCNSRSHWC